ncbi:unnamed protein product, partial [Ceratitis capitata]
NYKCGLLRRMSNNCHCMRRPPLPGTPGCNEAPSSTTYASSSSSLYTCCLV